MITICKLGKALHAAVVAALEHNRPAEGAERRWQDHKQTCAKCAGVKR